MLILKRKAGQAVVIGDDIVITVLPGKGRNQIRLGIEAPKEVLVLRTELMARSSDEQGQGASATH